MAFNWTQLIPAVAEGSHSEISAKTAVATLLIGSAVSVVLGLKARSALGSGEASVIPVGQFSVRGLFEVLTEKISKLAESVIGHEYKKFAPFFCSVFFFVLLNNLIGVIPGMTPATENINTTLAFGVFMFLFYNFQGVKANGIVAYLKHFCGPVIFLAPLMFVIEVISHMIRPVSLGLRLSNVMTGDHIVLSVFLELCPPLVPIIFYCLGLFVCLVQAIVFTLLSMVYVALAIAHEEH